MTGCASPGSATARGGSLERVPRDGGTLGLEGIRIVVVFVPRRGAG